VRPDRTVRWVRRHKAPDHIPVGQSDGAKPVTQWDWGFIGSEEVYDRPLYDNGAYFVIDTVAGLQFTICMMVDNCVRTIKAVELDKYEAIRLADDYKDADERRSTHEAEIERKVHSGA
jgi:hypothetical protein